MAVTENLYTGDGSTVLYSFTFPYLESTDVKVSLDGVDTTAYSIANATQVQLDAAPSSGVAIRVYRDTDDATIYADFFPGAAIKSADLNSNFDQVLYVGQEAQTTSNTANATSNSAETKADAAVVTAGNAVTTANNAVTTAQSAVNTANAADTTANSAVATANHAVSTANGAVSTANIADTNASAAVVTANTAEANSIAAVNTSNTAESNSTTALNNSREDDGSGGFITAITKANTALTNSREDDGSGGYNTAIDIANAANTTATSAMTAVASVVDYDPCANVSSIPTVTVATYLSVQDSTGIESFTPLTGVPTGFVGDSGLTVRISYDPTLSTWEWVQYFANDANNRFVKKAGDTFTGGMTFSNHAQFDNTAQFDSTAEFNGTANLFGNTKAIDFELLGNALTSSSGSVKFNCENNSHAITLKGPPHSAAASYTLTLPDALPTLNGQVLVSDLSGNTSFETIDAAYVETPQTITISKSIGANINAAMIGPTVSIASGTTITVSQNAYLTVLS